MVAKTKSINFPCSVADTESGPKIVWEKQKLILEFQSYLKEACIVQFGEVDHFELLVEDELDSELYHYDGAVEVLESEIIDRLVAIGNIDKSDASNYKHYVIGFNEIGAYISVVFKTMKTNCI